MKLSAPLKVDFNITSKCNYDCDFCYVPDKHIHGCEMSIEDIDKILSDLQQVNVLEVDISGGEPLTRKDIFKVFDLLKKYDFYYTFNTNGSLITKEIAKKIKECKFEFVGISIDDCNEDIYNLNRRTNNNFNNVINGIKMLLDEGVNVSLGITLTKYNVENLQETLNLAANIGVKTVGLQFICPNNERAINIMPSYEQWKRCFVDLTEAKKAGTVPINLNFNTTNESPVPWELYLPLKEEDKLQLLKEVWGYEYEEYEEYDKESFITCAAGKIRCAIASNGEVYECEMLLPYNELSKGNAIKQDFKEVWNKINLDKKLVYKRELNGECSKCKLNFCGGGCRAAARFFGDINGSDRRCPITNRDNISNQRNLN